MTTAGATRSTTNRRRAWPVVALASVLLVLTGCAAAPSIKWDSDEALGPVADLGFRPDRDGFSFANFGRGPNGLALSQPDVRALLGDSACRDDDPATDCLLAPRAVAFMADNQHLATGGVCEGMSTLALQFFTGSKETSAFGADTTHALTLPGNAALEREVLRMNATQLTEQTVASLRRAEPTDILETLLESFQTRAETYTLGLYNKRDGELVDGHTVVPYRLEHIGQGRVKIHIYNPNLPNGSGSGSEPGFTDTSTGPDDAIVVDTRRQTWSYDSGATFYDGSADLELAPLSARQSPHLEPKTLGDFRGSLGAPVHCRPDVRDTTVMPSDSRARPSSRAAVALRVTDGGDRFIVDVAPNSKDTDFIVEIKKRVGGAWRALTSARTRGPADIVAIAATPGGYRALLRVGDTVAARSGSVRLRSPAGGR